MFVYFFPENLAFLVEFMRRLGMFIDLELYSGTGKNCSLDM